MIELRAVITLLFFDSAMVLITRRYIHTIPHYPHTVGPRFTCVVIYSHLRLLFPTTYVPVLRFVTLQFAITLRYVHSSLRSVDSFTFLLSRWAVGPLTRSRYGPCSTFLTTYLPTPVDGKFPAFTDLLLVTFDLPPVCSLLIHYTRYVVLHCIYDIVVTI